MSLKISNFYPLLIIKDHCTYLFLLGLAAGYVALVDCECTYLYRADAGSMVIEGIFFPLFSIAYFNYNKRITVFFNLKTMF